MRGEGIAFTAPYVLIEGAFVVRSDSPLTDNAEVDRAGTRVVVGTRQRLRPLPHACVEGGRAGPHADLPGRRRDFLPSDAEHVAAGVKQQLQADAARLGGIRLLPGRFMVIEQAMGVPASRGEAARKVVAAFIERAKASGFVAAALKRHGIDGAIVAPAA